MRQFSVLFFADSLKRFIESLDYFVIAYDTCYNIAKYTNPLSTIQVGIVVLISIIWFEVVVALLLIVLGVFSIYNKFHRRVYTPPAICYSRNMQFLQNLIDFIAIAKSTVDRQIDECLFWSKPKKALTVLKVLLLGSPIAYFGLLYFPIRYVVAAGWVAGLVYMSDFGHSFVASAFSMVRLKFEVWRMSRDLKLDEGPNLDPLVLQRSIK